MNDKPTSVVATPAANGGDKGKVIGDVCLYLSGVILLTIDAKRLFVGNFNTILNVKRGSVAKDEVGIVGEREGTRNVYVAPQHIPTA